MISARVVTGPYLGQPLGRDELQHLRARPHQLVEHAAGVGRATVRAFQLAVQDSRSSLVSMSRANESSSTTWAATPAALSSARWRRRLSGPKPGARTSGGVSSSALVPVPRRSGRPALSALAGRVREQGLDVPGGERAAVAGDQRRSLDPVLEQDLNPDPGRRVVAALVILDDAGVVAVRDPLGSPDAADHHDPLGARHPPERDERVGEHRLDEGAAVVPRQAEAQALLGLGESLDEEDGQRGQPVS